jgi:hypothetical protein
MKRTDPDDRARRLRPQWLERLGPVVIDGLAPIIDWYSIHLYTGQAEHYTTVVPVAPGRAGDPRLRRLIERAR